MNTKQPDWKAIEHAVLVALKLQGFDFAEVHYRADYPDNPVFINVLTEDQISPKYVEALRITNQLDGWELLEAGLPTAADPDDDESTDDNGYWVGPRARSDQS